MNNGEFMNGQEFETIYFSDDQSITAGTRFADKILCQMECGQMSEVAWFEVWKDGKIVSKWNGAMLQGVQPKS